MTTDLQPPRAWLRRLALLALLALPAAASAGFSSHTSVQTPAGFVNDSGGSTSAVFIDADNYANSLVAPQRGTLGAAASNSFDGLASGSRSSFDDFWSCNAPCAVSPLPGGIVPLSLDFRLDGVLTDFVRHGEGSGDPSVELRASYQIGVFGTFNFQLQENFFDSDDGPFGGGSSSTYAQFCRQGNPICAALPIDVVKFIDANGDDAFRFSLDAHITSVMCPGCAAGFVDELSIDASVSGPAFIDAMHTFSVGVHSEDPNFEFTSANGRTTALAVSAVPEPGTLPLLLAGLAAIGTVVRRRAGGASRAGLSA